MAERIQRLEKAIDEAIEQAPPEMRGVVEALQALRGVAKVTAGTIVAELGSLSRFAKPRQLMGYSGLVSSEFTTGHRIQRGNQRHRLEGTVAPAQASEGCTVREAAGKLQPQTMATPRLRLPTVGDDGKQLVTRKRRVPAPLGFELGGIDRTHPYLAARGIDQPTAEQFGEGSIEGRGCSAGGWSSPSTMSAASWSPTVATSWMDRSEPRYRFPPRFAKSEILFNLHRAAARELAVVVVEGFLDCLKVHQAGIGSVVGSARPALDRSHSADSAGAHRSGGAPTNWLTEVLARACQPQRR